MKRIKGKCCLILLVFLIMFNSFFVGASDLTQGSDVVYITFTVECLVTGDTPTLSETFYYTLTALDEDNPMTSASDVNIIGSGETNFGTLVFKEVGVYSYTVTQKSGTSANYSYDETIYNIVVTIEKDENGDLSPSISVKKEGSDTKTSSILFKNVYTSPTVEIPNTSDVTYIGYWSIVAVLAVIGMLIFRKRGKKSATRA